jgi:cytochrome c peroxidase
MARLHAAAGPALLAALFFTGCDPDDERWNRFEALLERVAQELLQHIETEGTRVFDSEEFGGNGRTCVTCHSLESGTITLADVEQRLLSDPGDPLFQHDGLDADGVGTTRIAETGTIAVELELPPWVTLRDAPEQRTIVVHRSVPSTMNVPALDPVLMWDGRAAGLRDQALGAISGHAQNTIAPTNEELEILVAFERLGTRFFSSETLRLYARGGPPPPLPEGRTQAEKRGREMFVDAPLDGSTRGICAACHSGPMLNEVNEFANLPSLQPGKRFATVLVSERNLPGFPEYAFVVDDGPRQVEVTLPDPGAVLTDPPLNVLQLGSFFIPSLGIGLFKIPTLWGIGRTPPYFHDGSAATLEEVAEHYAFFLAEVGLVELTERDQEDMVAFMRLL